MDAEKKRRIESGKQKLQAYKERKALNKSDSEQSLTFSDHSLSLSPILLPENVEKTEKVIEDKPSDELDKSEPSSISENIIVSSPENDRSLQEIMITNIPGCSPDPTINNMFKAPDINVKSLNNSLLSETSFISLHALEMFENMNNNQFNLSEVIRPDDSLKSIACDDLSCDTLKDEKPLPISPRTNPDEAEIEPKNDENVPLSVDIESLREFPSSNHSTTSLGTSTDYKFYQDKSLIGSVEYQDLLSHRDDHIKQLTNALEQVLEDRNRFKEQADHFAKEIDLLKEQLVQTTAIVKKLPVSSSDSENEEVKKQVLRDVEASQNLNDVVDSQLICSNDGNSIKSETNVENAVKKEENVEKNTDLDETDHMKSVLEKDQPRSLSEKDTLSRLIRISDMNFDTESITFNDTLSPEEMDIIQDIRCKINLYIEQKMQEYKKVHHLEVKILEDQLESEKTNHVLEVAKLRELLTSVKSGSADIDELRKELNEKHSKEMEELRTYFEERCAEIEKHYSEEIFSQQSRKMSADSSLASELESEVFPNNPIGPAGDAPTTTQETNKTDINSLRLELQNKYHAELEILREDYENRIDELRINNENIQQENEKKYLEQIEALKTELEEAQKFVMTQQDVANSGDFEIAEVVQSYERRLQEQVMLAKMDIITALENQIQNLITNTTEDAQWPSELLQLREIIIKETKEQYTAELEKIKEDYEKKLSRAVEREKRNSIHSGDEADLKKERDNLKKVSSYLRNLIAELMKYFTKCEDELNNTLVEELLKQGIDKDLSTLDINDSFQSSISEKLDISMNSPKIKRVHFTPDVSGIITLLDETSKEALDTTTDLSFDFQNELKQCLQRLRSEANAILAATTNMKVKTPDLPLEESNKCIEDKLSSLTRQLITEKQTKNDLSLQLQNAKDYIQSLEADKISLEGQLDHITTKQNHLVAELDKAKEKIINLVESGRKEIVSEGYGENHITGSATFAERLASMAELQERARNMLSESGTSSPLLHLVEELCDEGDRIASDAKKDHNDLIQQIEAADKKLRAATKFMEDQAIERENERDEAQKEIATLKEQLRELEKSKNTADQINSELRRIMVDEEETDDDVNYWRLSKQKNAKKMEKRMRVEKCGCNISNCVLQTVERLESQMREMSVLIEESEKNKSEVEAELKEAIDKIWVLRDIIRDLESQIELQVKEEQNLKNLASQLQDKVKDQIKENNELEQQLHAVRNENRYTNKQMVELENEVHKLRDNDSRAVAGQVAELEHMVDKTIVELETLLQPNTSGTSSPSEDMSIRDQIAKNNAVSFSATSDPLEQLSRLKEKLQRHARAEDAAIKKIRDLEMQLSSTKHDFEELQGEKDVLQEQLSEQMHVISSLQLRLDEQRLRVESVQKETNTVLEHKVYELENQVKNLNEEIRIRDKNIKQLNLIVDQTKKLLADQQKQLNTASDLDKEIIDQLHKETETLRTENMLLKNRLQSENKLNQSIATPDIPELLDSMLSEKNADIDRLRNQLDEVKKELYYFKSLNITKDQLLNVSSDSTQKSKFSSMLSPNYEPDPYRRQEPSFDSLPEHSPFEKQNRTVFVGSSFQDPRNADKKHSPFYVSQVSTIEKLDSRQPLNLSDEIIVKRDSFSLPPDPKHYRRVHFNDTQISLENKVKELQMELDNKNATIKNLEESVYSEQQIDLRNLRKKLEFSESTLKETKDFLSEEIERLREGEKQLQDELSHTKELLQEKINELSILERENEQKQNIAYTYAKEKMDLQNKVKELEAKLALFENFEQQIIENNNEIAQLKEKVSEMFDRNEVENLQTNIKKLEDEISNLRKQNADLESSLKRKDSKISNLEESLEKQCSEINAKNDLISKYSKDCNNMASQFELLMSQVKQLEETIASNDRIIKDLEDSLKKKQDDITLYQQKIYELQNILSDYQYKMDSMNKDSLQLSKKELDFIEAKYKTELAEKDLKLTKNDTLIEDLKKEIHHLQDFIYQKDKIITQMTRDSNSLHQSLEAIQSKIQESGNVIDLKKRLRDEQSLTSALHEELQFLKHRLNEYECSQDKSIIKELKENLEKEHVLNTELLSIRESLMQDLHILEQKYDAERDAVSRLQLLLDEEKQKSNQIQLQDANIIQKMRERLEQALDNENDLLRQLETEKRTREEIQSKTGAISLDSAKINDAHFELACVRMDLVKATTENDILKSEFTTLNNLNSLLKAELEQTKQLTEVQRSEIEELKEKFVNLREMEQLEKDKIKRNKAEIEHRDLEIENSKGLLNELEHERIDMKKQIEEMRYAIDKYRQREQELNIMLSKERQNNINSQQIPEKFVIKMNELTDLLQENVQENNQMSKLIMKLEGDKKKLQSKINEIDAFNQAAAPFNDPGARADHLFAKFLKSESYRKALIFQKRYLITLLASYQNYSIEQLPNIRYDWPGHQMQLNHVNANRRNGISRFRVAAYAIISIHRMRFIVNRWHTGKRERGSSSSTIHRSISKLNFQHNFQAGDSVNENRPWSGNSPPCKDQNRKRNRDAPLGNILRESVTLSPLQAPQLLSQYMDRFDNIQQRLGLVSDHSPT